MARMRTFTMPPPRSLPPLPPGLKRRRPRVYLEWAALRRWGKLPAWEESPVGYLLREARERAGLSQAALAEKLGCRQQAISQAERADSNPTVRFLREWARALGTTVELEITFAAPSQDLRP